MPFPKQSLEFVPIEKQLQLQDLTVDLQTKLEKFSNTQMILDMITMGARFLIKSKVYIMKTKLVNFSDVTKQMAQVFLNQFQEESVSNLSFANILNYLFCACEEILDMQKTSNISFGSPTQNLVRKYRETWLQEHRTRVLEIFELQFNLREKLNTKPHAIQIYVELISRMDRSIIDYFGTKLPKQEETFEAFEFVLEQFVESNISDINSIYISKLIQDTKDKLNNLWRIENAETEVIQPISPPEEMYDSLPYLEPKPIYISDSVNDSLIEYVSPIKPKEIFKPTKPLLSVQEISDLDLDRKLYYLFGSEQESVKTKMSNLINSFQRKYRVYYKHLGEIFINQNFKHGFSNSQEFLTLLTDYFESFESQLELYLKPSLNNVLTHKRRKHLLRIISSCKTDFMNFNIQQLFRK